MKRRFLAGLTAVLTALALAPAGATIAVGNPSVPIVT
jgi:hypothetical protein